MLVYFKYSSNDHQLCCVKIVRLRIYKTITSPKSEMRLKLDYFFNLQYLRQYVSYCIQPWHDGGRMDTLYAHARIDDLDFDTRSQWVSKGKKSTLHALGN